MNKPKNKRGSGLFDECPGQTALFNILPVKPIKIIHDPYWDEIVKPAPEHSQDYEGSVLEQNSTPLQECVREQPHVLDFAPEHSLNNEGDAAPQENSFIDGSVREQSLISKTPNSPTGQQQPKQENKVNHWIETYTVSRGKKKHEYYRYMWMEGRKLKRCHIGPAASGHSKNRVAEARHLISGGKLTPEILDYLKKSK